MAKISRYNGNLQAFGVNSTGNYRTIFGDVSQSDALDDNVNADYLTGWEIIGITEAPSKQDFNALGFTQGQLLAYLHQMGTPEYNASQEYYSDSICTYDGIIYISLTDSNTGNAPDASPSNWDPIISSTFIVANYYSKTELDSGQLDNRYYTETELDAGQLDNRYYTETELGAGQLDNRYYTETELDAGQLDNRYYTEAEITSLLSGYILSTEKGAVNGVCPLDASGLVDSSYLPSYVDDILEYATYSALPVTGELGKIYVITTNGDGKLGAIYRWSGSVYVQIGSNVLQADDSLKLGGQLPAYYATDSSVVHLAGTETITGLKYVNTNFRANTYTTAAITSPVGIGVSPGDVNAAEIGAGYTTLCRDDTASAKQLMFVKNNLIHSGFQTTDSGLEIFGSDGNADLKINTSGNLDLLNHALLQIDWANSDDGTGSGLDADLWDGNQFADYIDQAVKTTSSPTFAAVTVTGGATGSFTSADAKTITVTSGIITSIV